MIHSTKKPIKENSLDDRSQELDKKLARYQSSFKKNTKEEVDKKKISKQIHQAIKLSSEFLAGIAIGIVLGFGIDYFLNTKPFALIIFTILGFCAGILNVLRSLGHVKPTAFDKINKM